MYYVKSYRTFQIFQNPSTLITRDTTIISNYFNSVTKKTECLSLGVNLIITMVLCSEVFSFITTIIFIVIFVPNIWIFHRILTIKDIICRVFVSTTLLVFFSPIITYFLIWLIIYRIIIKVILWIKHGGKFTQMLDGRDRMYTVQVTSPHVILFLIKYNEPFDFYAKMSHIIGKTLKDKFKDDKIFCTISSFLGYNYLVKSEIPYSKYVKPLPNISNDDLNKDSLLNAIEEHTQGSLPNENKGLWDVFIGTQEIVWKNHPDEAEEKFYPIVLRFHPCVSNILQIMNNILPATCVKENEEPKASKSCLALKSNSCCVCLVCVKKFVQKTGYFFITPSVFLVNILAMNNEENVKNSLYGPKLCQRKTFCVLDESTPDNIDMIKSIKNKFPGTTFQDVILTAFTASLEEYYDRVSQGGPAARPHFILSENYVSTRCISDLKTYFTNRTSRIILKLPIGLRSNTGEIPIVCMLKAISKERKLLAYGIESRVHNEMLNIFLTYVPTPLLQLLLSKYKFTTIVNNYSPDSPEERTIDGRVISNVYVWTPHRGDTGISLTIATYGGRLQLTLSVDKALISNRDEVQDILNGIYKNLVVLKNIEEEQRVTAV